MLEDAAAPAAPGRSFLDVAGHALWGRWNSPDGLIQAKIPEGWSIAQDTPERALQLVIFLPGGKASCLIARSSYGPGVCDESCLAGSSERDIMASLFSEFPHNEIAQIQNAYVMMSPQGGGRVLSFAAYHMNVEEGRLYDLSARRFFRTLNGATFQYDISCDRPAEDTSAVPAIVEFFESLTLRF